MEIPENREWLSYKEAQTISGYGRTTLWKLVGSGEIPAAKCGRMVRISRKGLSEYMWSQTQRSDALYGEASNARVSGNG